MPDSVLGNISEWERYLSLNLNRTDLPFKIADQFILNEDYHLLVTTSKLPRPGKFVEQTISFCISFCAILLSHEINKSSLVCGLACFDSAVILHGTEDQYVVAVENLTSHFVSVGWSTSSEKTKTISRYRSFVTKLRAFEVPQPEDWFQFLVSHYEMQCQPELYQVFKYASLCLPPLVKVPVPFAIPIPELGTDEDPFSFMCGRCKDIIHNCTNCVEFVSGPTVNFPCFPIVGQGKRFAPRP